MDPSSSSLSNKRKRDLDCYDEPRYKRPKFDVFVNYAPGDIGNGFASHLKGALGREGFTISDHKKLPNGLDKSSELLKAIEESEIYLVVFSLKYASYKECLDEFALIMETYPKFKKRKVFPIFFDVDPSHVRNQQGSFLEAFQGYEKNVDPGKVQIWRQALKEAGDKSGLNLKDCRNEEKLIRKIMKYVRKMENPQQICDVEHPVGIDSRAQDVISALRLSSIVAVLGISGSGKTTVVKAVYDKISADFDVSCFIQDINSYVYRGPNWKVDLQKDVISCLTGNDNFIASHNDGAAKIKKLISGRKLFLVLDDVYKFEQLQALSIDSASFHSGSRIIVTTRNAQSLSNLQHTSYNIELLDEMESFELFTRLIGKGDPMDEEFVDEIVRCAGGIPLVLEVWSRHFTDFERKLWPRMLETLKRIPHEDTQKKLRISYDSLPKRAQNLFLDIACFFEGIDKDLVVKVLQDEDFFPEFEIQNLVHKFLVKFDGWEVSLHDVIREMGQEVVRQEDEDEPGKRTRLMGYRDVVRVLGDCSGTDSVRSIRLLYMFKQMPVLLDAFKKMSNLRFIKLAGLRDWSSSSNDDMLAGISFKQLRYLEWDWFPYKSLDNIDMGNVVVIRLYESKLEKLWEGVKSLNKLKILDVFNASSLIKIGSFIGLENLEELRLKGCENLKELDSSICCLKKLVELDLSNCSRLKRLPWEMIGKLTSPEKLDLKNHTNVVEISNEVGSFLSLRYLLPSKNKFNHPNSLYQLHQLHHMAEIELSKCTNLKSIPDLPPNTKYLRAVGCENLVNLPSNISELQYLMYLQLDNCTKLGSEGFTQITRLGNLEILKMSNCNVSQVPNGIGNMVSLEYLDLSENIFSSIPESFNNLPKLEKLDISYCSRLQLLPPLPSQLKSIDATKCGSLDVMSSYSMQNSFSLCSIAFKDSRLMSNEGLLITLSGKEVPEWCIYEKSGNVLSFVAPIELNTSICGLILCATRDTDYECEEWGSPTIYNKTKGTSHHLVFRYDEDNCGTMMVMFYPLNDTKLVVEAGDTVQLEFSNEKRHTSVKSVGLRLVYEDDVVDSRLFLKDVRKPTLSLSSLSLLSDDDIDDDDDNDDDLDPELVLKDVRKPATLSLFPLSSEIMTGNSINLIDEEVYPFPIPNDEYLSYNLSPWYLDLEQFVMQGMSSSSGGEELA